MTERWNIETSRMFQKLFFSRRQLDSTFMFKLSKKHKFEVAQPDSYISIYRTVEK